MKNARRVLIPLALVIGLLALIPAARILSALNRLDADARTLKNLSEQETFAFAQAEQAGDLFAQTARDFRELRDALGASVHLLPAFGWFPRYGGELANAPALLDFGEQLTVSAQATLTLANAFDVAVEAGRATGATTPESVLRVAETHAEAIQQARQKLATAQQARAQIDATQLSPARRELVERADKWLPLWQTGLDALALAPQLLGGDRPRVYLFIAQNSDELRATGGLISGVALVRVARGKIAVGEFQDSYAVDDYTKRHPVPPVALQKYMDAPQWVFRDANWSPDFPTSARQLAAIYQLDRGVAADGVIAVNYKLIARLLAATGAITLETYNERVDATNVLAKLQTYWASPTGKGQTGDWWAHRKDFSAKLFETLMRRVTTGEADRAQLARVFADAITSKDVLIYSHDAEAINLGGTLYTGADDALLVVDSNVGFNKVDPSVDRQIEYAVTVEPDGAARARVTVTYTNLSPADGTACAHAPHYRENYLAMQQECYWNYVRVFAPAGSQLLAATGVSDAVTERAPEARAVFGGYFVLPRGEKQIAQFEYRLPAGLRAPYVLHLEKQPGSAATPARVRVVTPSETWDVAATLDRDHIIRASTARAETPVWLGAALGVVGLGSVGGVWYIYARGKRCN